MTNNNTKAIKQKRGEGSPLFFWGLPKSSLLPMLLLYILLSTVVHTLALGVIDNLFYSPSPLPSGAIQIFVRLSRGDNESHEKKNNTQTISSKEPQDSNPGTPASTETTGAFYTQPYYKARQLDVQPSVIHFFDFSKLELPPQAHGTLVIQIWINEHGTVDQLEIQDNNIPLELTRTILEQRRAILFNPGKKDGQPVRSIARYELSLAPGFK